MLQLKNIRKTYATGENAVHALRGIDLAFRTSDFVSILGPSGCGKTTMLNIIGGLDQYTEGDLVIDGVSTKSFKDRDWDAYRNHSIGFVFQSYNLIPHQTVLRNVELALTLSGVPKKERRQRAKQALEKVGLGDQLKKRPGQMSGGQMQRVAIARALVNDPDIILADEPTGALDTETSVQVMELLKEISRERLVIMVTHNPELAEKYSTRIIRMLDGKITDDSAPLSREEMANAKKIEGDKLLEGIGKKKTKKPSMSLATSFGLSLNNLFTKKGRTALTSFAGSIGIIGIALIYAVSQGTSAFISAVQEDTLSSYPLTIEASTLNIGDLMQTFMGVASDTSDDHELDGVYSQSVMLKMINALNNLETTENDLKSFKAYLEQELAKGTTESKLREALTGVLYSYDLDLLVYTKSVDNKIIKSDAQELLTKAISKHMGMDMMESLGGMASSPMASSPMSSMMMSGSMSMWTQLLPGYDGKVINPLLEKQYDMVYGSWPNSYDEIVLVLDENNELDDLTLYALGLETEAEIDAVFEAVLKNQDIEIQQKKWTYEEICDMEFKVILNSDCYTLDEKTGLYTDLRSTDTGLRYLYDNGLSLKVTGIIRPSEDATAAMITGSIGYTVGLTEYIIEHAEESEAIKAQLASPDVDILTGLPFDKTAEMTVQEMAQALKDHIKGLNEAQKAALYVKIMSTPSQETLDAEVEKALGAMTREQMEQNLINAMLQNGMSQADVETYVKNMSDEDLKEIFAKIIAEQVKKAQAQMVQGMLAGKTPQELAMALEMSLPSYTEEQCAQYYAQTVEFSKNSYEMNLKELGSVDLDSPDSVSLYASSFENKDVVEQFIADYNSSREELQQLHYTDYVGLMMSSITTILDAITYVLIAFVSISLVVSAIMIGVITLISVQERTKEIGILRAIGASKKNVSSMFNAETIIIGFTAGLLGIGVTYLLCIPINALVYALTGLANLQAQLPLDFALFLVGLSVVLTTVAGVIPSRSAAKKDPVVALRTE